MADGYIGHLSWDDCSDCQNYRPVEGGCLPLDERGPSILGFDVGTDTVICDEFKQIKS